MGEKLSFTAFLQDEYSNNFNRLAGLTDAGVKAIEKNLSKLSKTGKGVTRNIDELNKRIEVLTRVRRMTIDTSAIKFATGEIKKLQKEKDRLEGKTTNGENSVWNIAAGVGIAQYGPRAIQMATGLFKSSIQASMKREQQRISLGVLLGGEKQGNAMLSEITKEAARTPFGTEDLLKSTQTMLGFGVAQEKVLPIMRQLGDISGGNADRFQSLTLAFSQMSSTGRLMGQDLLQMVNAGFNPLNEISKMTGKSMGSLKKEMEEGKISAELVMKAMSRATSEGGLYYQMMEKQSKTTEGRLATLNDEINEMSVSFGEKFKPAIDGSIDALSAMIGTVRKWTLIPASEKIKDQSDKLRVLKTELMDTNIQEDRRKSILAEINSNYGEYLKGLNLEKASYDQINAALETTITLLDKKSQKARLNEILNNAETDLGNLYKSRVSLVNYLYKKYGKDFPDIMNQEGLTTEQRIGAIRIRLKSTTEGNVVGSSSRFEGETENDINTFFRINNDIVKAQKTLKETKDDVIRQMKDEGLNDVSLDDDYNTGAGKSGTGGKTSGSSSASSSGSSSPSISGGSKVTHINISIDSLVKGGVNIYSTAVKESAAQMRDVVIEALLTAVNDANLVAEHN